MVSEVKVDVWFKSASEPRCYQDVKDTYQEGAFFCILLKERIYKYPVADIFRVVEYL